MNAPDRPIWQNTMNADELKDMQVERYYESRTFWSSRKDALTKAAQSYILPPDATVLVVQLLEPADILMLGATCRAWYTGTTDKRVWKAYMLRWNRVGAHIDSVVPWKEVCLNFFYSRTSEERLQRTQRVFPSTLSPCSELLYRQFIQHLEKADKHHLLRYVHPT